MKTILATILFATVFQCVASQNMVHYNVNNIKCVNLYHEYNKYYTSPCEQWLREMNETNPSNIIRCVTSVDGFTGKQMHGCSPAFGRKQDSIFVKYYFKKTDSDTCILNNPLVSEYTIRAEVGLRNPYHPITVVLVLSVLAFMIIVACLCEDNHSYRNNYNDAFWGAYMGSAWADTSFSSNDSWSWTTDE